jgi:hypothetical protein
MSPGLWLAAAVAAASAMPAPVLVQPQEHATYEALVIRAALDANSRFQGACPDAKAEHIGSKPIVIRDHPDTAFAQERVRVTGCGHVSVENINSGRMGGDPPWRLFALLPGDSIADASLQETTAPQAVATARTDIPADCTASRIDDLYIAAWPGQVMILPTGAKLPTTPGVKINLPPNLDAIRDTLDLKGAWAEVWPFQMCDKDRTMMVLFIPTVDHKQSYFLFLPVWPQIIAHGPGARPVAAPRPEGR